MNREAPVRLDVVVVDDHPFFCEGLVSWISRQKELRFAGAADSVALAYELIAAARPDLVLLDLQLRDSDGLELLRLIKEVQPKPRVIVLSHKDQTIFAERALQGGAVGYVLKDEATETLHAAIRTVVSGGIHLSPEMNRKLYKSRNVATQAPADKLRRLYNRELQVLEHFGCGRTTKEIAQLFGISVKTVESYRESLKRKLEVPDSVALVRLATIWQQGGKWGIPDDCQREQVRSSQATHRPIVVVDHDADDLAEARRTFIRSGVPNPLFAFQDAGEMRAHLEAAARNADPAALPLVVFVDLKMPALMGAEIVKWARADRRFDDVRFVVLSSSLHPHDHDASRAAGADDFLIKFPPSEVFADIVSLAAQHPRYLANVS